MLSLEKKILYASFRFSKLFVMDQPVFLYKLVKLYTNLAAILGSSKSDRSKIRQKLLWDLWFKLGEEKPMFSEYSLQDSTFPERIKASEKVMIVLTPEYGVVTGGILSIFSIASQMRREKRIHGYDVIVMTLPSKHGITHFRNTFFRSEENIYRFSQILLCKAAKDVYLQIPEYASKDFYSLLSTEEREYLQSRELLHINILNQNIMLMPSKSSVEPLRALTKNISQSVAHHAYFSQEIADKHGLPTMLLPAYTDLTAYPPAEFAEKKKLIIYSPDEANHKQRCLEVIAARFPEFKLQEIRGITFDYYMELATSCMFSITFGEGFDGYLAQPIYQGGIGFATYNEDFFPSKDFLRYENIFQSNEQMVDEICNRIHALSTDETRYRNLNAQLVSEYHKLYSHSDYVRQLRKLALKEFVYLPS